jgi:hypothetical protein
MTGIPLLCKSKFRRDTGRWPGATASRMENRRHRKSTEGHCKALRPVRSCTVARAGLSSLRRGGQQQTVAGQTFGRQTANRAHLGCMTMYDDLKPP